MDTIIGGAGTGVPAAGVPGADVLFNHKPAAVLGETVSKAAEASREAFEGVKKNVEAVTEKYGDQATGTLAWAANGLYFTLAQAGEYAAKMAGKADETATRWLLGCKDEQTLNTGYRFYQSLPIAVWAAVSAVEAYHEFRRAVFYMPFFFRDSTVYKILTIDVPVEGVKVSASRTKEEQRTIRTATVCALKSLAWAATCGVCLFAIHSQVVSAKQSSKEGVCKAPAPK